MQLSYPEKLGMCSIIRVDLKFPQKPVVSAAAKDLICKVWLIPSEFNNLNSLLFVACFSHFWGSCELFLFITWRRNPDVLSKRNWSLHWTLCLQLLVKNSTLRLPLKQVLSHPWIVTNVGPNGIAPTGQTAVVWTPRQLLHMYFLNLTLTRPFTWKDFHVKVGLQTITPWACPNTLFFFEMGRRLQETPQVKFVLVLASLRCTNFLSGRRCDFWNCVPCT